MSLVKCRNKKTGITYVYESESYWDKEKKQPRARRKLIGKIDEETGEIVPTDGRGRKRKTQKAESDVPQEDLSDCKVQMEQKDAKISELTEENRKLKEEMDTIIKGLESILEVCKAPKSMEKNNDVIE